MVATKEIVNQDFGEKTFPLVDQLYNYILLITGDDSKAEKILIKAYKKAAWFYENLSKETDIRLWMFRIIMKIARDDLPAIKDSGELLNKQEPLDLAGSDKILIEQKPNFTYTKKIIQNISLLSFEMKEVLTLTDHLKFNLENTADLIDIPEGTVKKRLFDARKLFLIKLFNKSGERDGSPISFEDKKLITTFIDKDTENRPNERIVEKFKSEIEDQKLAKTLIETYLPLQKVRETIKHKIIKRFAPDAKNHIDSEKKKERKGLVTGATVIMFILIAIMIMLNRPTTLTQQELALEQKGENNILLELKDNYFKFREITYANDIIYGNTDSLKSYLNSLNLSYDPVFFNYKNWKPAGCFIIKISRYSLFNYIYKNDNHMLYIFQVPISLVDSQILKLSDNLINYLSEKKCFVLRENEDIFVLRKLDENIFGYALKSSNNDIILEICQ